MKHVLLVVVLLCVTQHSSARHNKQHHGKMSGRASMGHGARSRFELDCLKICLSMEDFTANKTTAENGTIAEMNKTIEESIYDCMMNCMMDKPSSELPTGMEGKDSVHQNSMSDGNYKIEEGENRGLRRKQHTGGKQKMDEQQNGKQKFQRH